MHTHSQGGAILAFVDSSSASSGHMRVHSSNFSSNSIDQVGLGGSDNECSAVSPSQCGISGAEWILL